MAHEQSVNVLNALLEQISNAKLYGLGNLELRQLDKRLNLMPGASKATLVGMPLYMLSGIAANFMTKAAGTLLGVNEDAVNAARMLAGAGTSLIAGSVIGEKRHTVNFAFDSIVNRLPFAKRDAHLLSKNQPLQSIDTPITEAEYENLIQVMSIIAQMYLNEVGTKLVVDQKNVRMVLNFLEVSQNRLAQKTLLRLGVDQRDLPNDVVVEYKEEQARAKARAANESLGVVFADFQEMIEEGLIEDLRKEGVGVQRRARPQ